MGRLSVVDDGDERQDTDSDASSDDQFDKKYDSGDRGKKNWQRASPKDKARRRERRPRRRVTPWEYHEVDSLLKGVAQYGRRWKTILEAFSFSEGRTGGDLKDKYRNILLRVRHPTTSPSDLGDPQPSVQQLQQQQQQQQMVVMMQRNQAQQLQMAHQPQLQQSHQQSHHHHHHQQLGPLGSSGGALPPPSPSQYAPSQQMPSSSTSFGAIPFGQGQLQHGVANSLWAALNGPPSAQFSHGQQPQLALPLGPSSCFGSVQQNYTFAPSQEPSGQEPARQASKVSVGALLN